MNFFHCTLDIITRNEGRSAVAAAAYRSGTRLENTWNGTVCDYRRKHAVVYSEIMLPLNAPRAYLEREVLWNSVEWSEKKKNAQLARDMELSLPAELPREEQIKLVRDYVQKTFVDEGMCADFSIHDPDGENPNPHCHLMLTMRPLDENGQWAQKSRLIYDLDSNGQRIQKKNGEWKTHKEKVSRGLLRDDIYSSD